MTDVLPLFILPLNKEYQLRSGKGGQEVHDHTNCIYFLCSFQRVSDMTLGCLESLTCLMTLKDLHFPLADNLCAYMVIQRTLCGFTCSHLIKGTGLCLPWRPLMNQQEDARRRLRGICGFKKELRVCWMAMES